MGSFSFPQNKHTCCHSLDQHQETLQFLIELLLLTKLKSREQMPGCCSTPSCPKKVSEGLQQVADPTTFPPAVPLLNHQLVSPLRRSQADPKSIQYTLNAWAAGTNTVAASLWAAADVETAAAAADTMSATFCQGSEHARFSTWIHEA